MRKTLIEYYENELNFLNEQGKELSIDYPHLTNNLDFSNNSNDPDIKKLIESVALLNAKLSKNIEEYSTNTACNILYSLFPEFQKPLPSSMVVIFQSNNANFNKKKILKNTVINLNNDTFVLNYNFYTVFDIEIASFVIKNVSITPFLESNLNNVYEVIQFDTMQIAAFNNEE